MRRRLLDLEGRAIDYLQERINQMRRQFPQLEGSELQALRQRIEEMQYQLVELEEMHRQPVDLEEFALHGLRKRAGRMYQLTGWLESVLPAGEVMNGQE